MRDNAARFCHLLLFLPLFLLRLLFCLPFCLLTLCNQQHPRIVFRMLLEPFRPDPIIRQHRIMRQRTIFFDNLLWCATNAAFRSGTIEHTIDDITVTVVPAIIILVSRTRFI